MMAVSSFYPLSTSPTNEAHNEKEPQQPISIKCILLGDSAVGKTSLVVSYTSNDYPSQHHPSALDTFYVEVNADNRPVQLQICDAGGSAEASSLRHLSYLGAHVILLCFSVVQPGSFRALRDRWIKELLDSCLVLNPAVERLANLSCSNDRYDPKNSAKPTTKSKVKVGGTSRSGKSSSSQCTPALLLVGCACDLRYDIGRLLELSKTGEEPVDKSTAEQLAADLGAEAYIECSALTQKNLKTVFDLAIWCGLRVASSGGPLHRIQPVDGLSNGNGSVASLGESSRSSHRPLHNLIQSNHTMPLPRDTSGSNSKGDKRAWRKFLCIH